MLLPRLGAFEIPDETDGFGFGVGNRDERSLLGQQFQPVRLETAGGLDEPLQRRTVEAGD
jgi:hypothetical protein